MKMATESLNLSFARTLVYHEEYIDLMPKWAYAASAFVLFLIGFFGFFLNLLVIILMCKDKQLWTPLNIILFNLVCSDFSVSILGNPFTLISALYHRWVFGKTMCIVYGFFMTLLGITSITTLTVLSFERYIMVSRPLTSHRLSMKGASFSVMLIWCYSFAVTTPPLFGWGKYVNEAANISCSINWEEQTINALTYILFLFAMGLIIPVVVITFSYMKILKTMKSNTCRMGRVAKAESRVTVMVFLMIVTFMVAWTPYSIFALIEQFAPRDLVSPGLGVIPALVAKSSICYDPIIYVGMNTQFRSSVKRLLGFGSREDSSHERAVENTIMSPTRGVSHTNANNITLQYLNPNDNTLLAVTLFKEDETKIEGVHEKIAENRVNQSKSNKTITIVTNSLEEKLNELSQGKMEDYFENDKMDQSRIDFVNEESGTNKDVYEILENDAGKVINSKPNEKEDSHHFTDRNIKSMNKQEDGKVDSKEYLLDDINNYEGYENVVSNILEENDSQNSSSDRPVNKSEFTESVENKKKIPSKRRSFAYTNLKFNEDFSDVPKIKDISIRRQSSANYSIGSGYSKKMTSVSHDKGISVTRLMVDERDKSKLINIGEFTGNKSFADGEQLL